MLVFVVWGQLQQAAEVASLVANGRAVWSACASADWHLCCAMLCLPGCAMLCYDRRCASAAPTCCCRQPCTARQAPTTAEGQRPWHEHGGAWSAPFMAWNSPRGRERHAQIVQMGCVVREHPVVSSTPGGPFQVCVEEHVLQCQQP
jgi:hypothetical protein